MASSFWIPIALQCLAWTATAGPAPTCVEREVWVMGTRLRITVEAALPEAAARASEAALREVERFDRMLSTWSDASELSAVNAAPVGHPNPVSAELGSLLREVEAWAGTTNRAFDPTVGALLDAWDVRGAGRTPEPTQLNAALEATGAGTLELGARTATRLVHGARLDAGAFGKGAALRSVADLLRDLHVQRALVDLGGQVWAEAEADEPWELAVAHPARRHEAVARLRVHGVSVATSGASERPGHIIDPRTGARVPAWGSVTVVSTDALEADILATALFVMGPAEGLAWARTRPGLSALFLEHREGRIYATWTPAMEGWLVEAPTSGPAAPGSHTHH